VLGPKKNSLRHQFLSDSNFKRKDASHGTGGSDWKSDKGLIKLKLGESLILPVRPRCANRPK
jgi:hypothetical protein